MVNNNDAWSMVRSSKLDDQVLLLKIMTCQAFFPRPPGRWTCGWKCLISQTSSSCSRPAGPQRSSWSSHQSSPAAVSSRWTSPCTHRCPASSGSRWPGWMPLSAALSKTSKLHFPCETSQFAPSPSRDIEGKRVIGDFLKKNSQSFKKYTLKSKYESCWS